MHHRYVRELAEVDVDVVCVRIAGNAPRLDDLHKTVHHPRGSGALRVPRQRLLRHDEDRVARAAAEVLQLLVSYLRFVHVIRLGRRAVE